MNNARVVPAVLPLVEAAIADDETITVAVDGTLLTPSDPVTRENLRAHLVALSAERGTPCKVRVKQADGRSFIDFVTPDEASHAPVPPSGDSPVAVPVPVQREPFELTDTDGLLVGLCGAGFLPGEPVAFAVVVTDIDADDDGAAVLRLPAAALTRRPGPFVLFGQRSGTLVVADPFGGDRP